MDIFVRG
ncbi:Protein of unknown function [Pyronema omphalodes CBS 100304]|nr:Protein of unknown function [Pyronema omphalodes CBS 100304]